MSDVRLTISHDAALVVFEWLHRFNESDDSDALVASDRQALWDLEAALEKEISELFDKDYVCLVARARSRLTCDD